MTQGVGPLARELSRPYYDDALPAHDRFHANRVRDVAVRLANESEKTVDSGVLEAAAWLHDIGRPLERTGEIENHDEWAAAEAEQLLASEAVSTDRRDAVVHCIRSHSIRASSPEPETPEAELLFDADKLDAAGAVGLVRMACIVGERSERTGEKHAVLDNPSVREDATSDRPDVTILREWAKERLDRLYTAPGRRLGESRWRFMTDFFARIDGELGVEAEN